MFKILFFKIFCVLICYAETGSQLKNPITNAYDFSYENNLNESIQNFKKENILEKVLIQIGKQTITTRRDNYVFSCLNDSLGSTYCPAALAPANKYSTYEEAVVIEKEASVIDYEKGTYQELTSTVRDFVNGTSSPHTNIEVNYLNGTSSHFTTGVIDYTNKENGLDSSSYTPSLAKPLIIGSNSVSINFNNRGDTGHNLNAFTCGSVVMMNESCIDGQGNYGSRSGWGWNSNVNMFDITVPSTIEGSPSLKYDSDLVGGSNNGGCSSFSRNILEPTYNNLLSNKWIIKTTSVLDGSAIATPQIINGQCKINVKAYEATYTQNTNKFIIKGYSGTGIPYTSLGNIVANNINLYTQDNNFYINGISITSPDALGFYTSVFVNIFFEYAGKLEYQPCPSTYAFFDGKCISQSIKQTCPTGYSDNGTNCKKDVMYNFYSYGCPSGYSPKNSGFTTFTKSDPDPTIINDYTLDDDVNSATPPSNNCVQTLSSTAYEYLCTSGYNPITPGLTSCPAGTSGNCNNPAPPVSNCYKDISYKHYTYGCSDGYITDNYGLATCTKTDPDPTKNDSATLDDDCNSPTPPDGNCRKQYSYKFYEYKCTGINAYNEPWIALTLD